MTSSAANPRSVGRRVQVPPVAGLIGRRLVRFMASVWALITFAFLIIHLTPGDPVRAAMGPTTPVEVIDARRAALGLDDSLSVQYVNYLRHLATGDLGESFQSQLPVAQIIGDRLPHTLALAIAAFVATVVIAIPLGLVMAVRTQAGRGRVGELTFVSTATVLGTIPDFLVAILAGAVFAVSLGWLPIAGAGGIVAYVIPVVALAMGPTAGLARIVRVESRGVLQADYIRSARAKRLPAWWIYARHALPNALTATLTVSGLLLAGLIAGTVLVEQVVAWPGLGPTLTSSIINKDFPLAQGIVLMYGGLVLSVNLCVDLAITVLDPRSTLREA